MKEFKSKKPSFYIRTLLKEELYEALEFVIMTNYLHYQKVKPLKEIKYELEQIYKDEIKYFEDTIFYLVLNTENKIIGTIRLRKWSRTNPFLLPGIFSNYNIERENIWHVGRFAISNTADITFKKYIFVSLTLWILFSMISCSNEILPLDESSLSESTETKSATQREGIEIGRNLKRSFLSHVTRADISLYPDYFGGMYLNKEGRLVVLVTGDTTTYKEKIQQRALSNNFLLKPCAYSYKELIDIINQLNKFFLNKVNKPLINEIQLDGFGLMDKNNRIAIRIRNCNDEKIEKFKKEISNFPGFVFENSLGDAQLQANLKPGGPVTTLQNQASIGYRARNGANIEGIVVSGHLVNSIGGALYEGFSGNLIGYAIDCYKGPIVDAAFVPVNNSTFIPVNMTTSGISLSTIVDDLFSGASITLEGKTSGRSYGEIDSYYQTGTFPSPTGGTITITNAVSATYLGQDGDSGGIIYASNGTHYTTGIHMGRYNGKAHFILASNINSIMNLQRY